MFNFEHNGHGVGSSTYLVFGHPLLFFKGSCYEKGCFANKGQNVSKNNSGQWFISHILKTSAHLAIVPTRFNRYGQYTAPKDEKY